MLKQSSLSWQKKALDAFPMNPQELTPDGLSQLRRNAIVSILSVAACFVLCLISVRWTRQIPAVIEQHGVAIMFLQLGAILAGLFGTLWVVTKSSDGLLASGLYWRANVSDELQDEWELAQKHRSNAKAFEYVLLGLVAVFFSILAYCGLHKVFTGALPSPPSFGVWVVACLIGIYVISLAPLLHLAWTLEPMDTDDVEAASPERVSQRCEIPLTAEQARLKWLWNWGPLLAGAAFGVVFAVFKLMGNIG